MATLLYGTANVVLIGGPYRGQTGNVTRPEPKVLALGPEGGFAYELVATGTPTLEYHYAPHLSTLHEATVEADRQAILEVAQRENVSPEVVLRRVMTARANNPNRPHPADELVEEAERLGVPPAQLLMQLHLTNQGEGNE